jgi:hypothetical protein
MLTPLPPLWLLGCCPVSQRLHKSWVGLIDWSADHPGCCSAALYHSAFISPGKVWLIHLLTTLVAAPLPRITLSTQFLGRFDWLICWPPWLLLRCPVSQRLHKSWVGLIDSSADHTGCYAAALYHHARRWPRSRSLTFSETVQKVWRMGNKKKYFSYIGFLHNVVEKCKISHVRFNPSNDYQVLWAYLSFYFKRNINSSVPIFWRTLIRFLFSSIFFKVHFFWFSES